MRSKLRKRANAIESPGAAASAMNLPSKSTGPSLFNTSGRDSALKHTGSNSCKDVRRVDDKTQDLDGNIYSDSTPLFPPQQTSSHPQMPQNKPVTPIDSDPNHYHQDHFLRSADYYGSLTSYSQPFLLEATQKKEEQEDRKSNSLIKSVLGNRSCSYSELQGHDNVSAGSNTTTPQSEIK